MVDPMTPRNIDLVKLWAVCPELADEYEDWHDADSGIHKKLSDTARLLGIPQRVEAIAATMLSLQEENERLKKTLYCLKCGDSLAARKGDGDE